MARGLPKFLAQTWAALRKRGSSMSGGMGGGLQLGNDFFAYEKTVLALTTPKLFCLGKGPFTT